MTINELNRQLRANRINERACLILPPVPVEGGLCLIRTGDGRWRVILNERGEFLINETLQSEHDACRFFLKKALLNPTNREDFTPALLLAWPSRKKELLTNYGFDANES